MQMKNLIVFVCGLLLSTTIWAQQKTITGNISDETGQPLPGVNVIVKGTTVGTVTQPDGTFTLQVRENVNSLMVSFIGYVTQEVDVTSNLNVSIQLKIDAIGLEEVVAVGYGTQKKVNLTGSVVTIGGEQLAAKPVAQASMALQGVASGVTVTQSTGLPGQDVGTIRIRGIGTLGNSAPLILIDGFSGNLNGIDPNDIESISVLKDAASAAIYGSRAANGVILVTTKRGKKGDVKLNYRGHVGWQQFTELPEYVDGVTFLEKNNEARINVGKSPQWSDDYIANYKANNGLYNYEYPNVDWQDLMFSRPGFQQSHNMSISGGNETLSSMLSLSYLDQGGIMENVDYKRYGIRLNNDYKISDRIQFKLDLNVRNSVNDLPPGDPTVIVQDIQRYYPVMAAYTPDGRYATNFLGYPNALAKIREGGTQEIDNLFFNARIALNIQPLEGMNLSFNYSPNYAGTYSRTLRRPVPLYIPESTSPAQIEPNLSTLTERNSRTWSNSLQAIATYKKNIGAHTVDLLGGFEQIDSHSDWFSAFRENFPFIDYAVLNNGSEENKTNGGTKSEWALRSWFGRVSYNFNEKYLFEANVRYDGSSRFATGNKFGVFPSASAAWRISEEGFMKKYSWLDNLKLRASWGQLGNQNIGTYPFASVVSLGQDYVLNGMPVSGAALTEMANELITWETSTSSNIGIDMGLWNKVTASFDYYVRNTDDILLQLPIPGTIGLQAPYQNAGKVKNKGWDISVNYRNHDNKFKYSAGLILSDVKNEVIDLNGTGPYIGSYTIKQEGDPINALYLLESDGLFQSQEEIDNHATQFGTLAPGDIKYVDQLTVDTNDDGIPDEADGKIDDKDRIVAGSNIPRYTFGIDLNAEYKGFDLSVFLQGVGKRQSYYSGQVVWPFYNVGNMQKFHLDSWSETNKDASQPRLIEGSSHNNYKASDFYMFNSAYLRVKNVQVGYTVPARITKKMGVDILRIYGSANNLFTFSHLPTGLDPEKPQGSDSRYPITSTYVFGIDLSF